MLERHLVTGYLFRWLKKTHPFNLGTKRQKIYRPFIGSQQMGNILWGKKHICTFLEGRPKKYKTTSTWRVVSAERAIFSNEWTVTAENGQFWVVVKLWILLSGLILSQSNEWTYRSIALKMLYRTSFESNSIESSRQPQNADEAPRWPEDDLRRAPFPAICGRTLHPIVSDSKDELQTV